MGRSATCHLWHWSLSVCYSIPALLIGVLLFAVGLERCVHSLSQELHLTGVGQTLSIFMWKQTFTLFLQRNYKHFLHVPTLKFLQSSSLEIIHFHLVSLMKFSTCLCTWVEENDGSKAAQLCLVHLHVSHLAYKLCQNSEEGGGERRKAERRGDLQE